MHHPAAENCMMTGTFAGTGPEFTVAAVDGRQDFAGRFGTGSGNTFDVTVHHKSQDQWARWVAYMADATTIHVVSTEEGSDGTNTIDWLAGTKELINDVPAKRRADRNLLDGLSLMALARALGVALFAGNRFADSFDALTYVDAAGATNLDSGTAGLLQPTTSSPTYGPDLTNGTTATASGGGGEANGNDNNNATVFPTSDVSSGYWWEANIASPAVVKKYTFRTAGVEEGVTRCTAITQIKLLGYNGSSWVTIDTWNTGTLSGATTYTRDPGNFTNSTSYQDYRLEFTLSGSERKWGAEVELFEQGSPGGANNMTVASAALVAASAPASMKLVAQTKHIDSITLGADLIFEVSRDNGATWTAATMNDRFTVNSIHVLESAAIDVSAQPAGTQVKWRARTQNNKSVELHGVYIDWS
jgi:hypothetical protein